MFDKVLNMLLNWLSKLKMCYFKINLNIKGNKQPSTREKQKEYQPNFKIIEQNCF